MIQNHNMNYFFNNQQDMFSLDFYSTCINTWKEKNYLFEIIWVIYMKYSYDIGIRCAITIM